MASVGVISMGKMGVTLAHSLINSGHEVFHASELRSEITKKNAIEAGVIDVVNPEKLFDVCNYVFCIIKDGDWRTYAEMAINTKYRGIYVDFNGLCENDIDWIIEAFNNSEVDYVDGAIRGWPLSEYKNIPDEDNPAFADFEPRTMYLSGDKSNDVARLHTDDFWVINECQPPAKYVVLDIAEAQKQKLNQS
jgi:hypothetical protein